MRIPILLRVASLILLASLVLVAPARANTIHVPVEQPTIQSGLNAASTGDTVLVAPGTYTENVVWPTTQALCLRSEAGPEMTIIDGSNPAHPDSGSVVVISGEHDRSTVLEGFTITNGSGTLVEIPESAYHGGAVWLQGSSPTIADNIIKENDDSRIAAGGAIACVDGAPVIRGNRIIDNMCTGAPFGLGGGIFLGALNGPPTEPIIMGNDITGNLANWGGGIAAFDSSPTIDQNTIADNTAVNNGGAIEFQPAFPGSSPGCTPIITGNTITGNTGQDGLGGGITGYGPTADGDPYIAGNAVTGNMGGGIRINAFIGPNNSVIESCIVSENTVYGIRCDNGAMPMIEYCVISNNTLGNGVVCMTDAKPMVRHCDIIGHSPAYGLFNMTTTVTIEAEFNWWGDASGPYNPTSNPSGLGDRVSDHVDYEPWSVSSAIASPGSQAPGRAFMLSQNYPNPFNPLTTIEFSLARRNQVTLRVYDVLGQEVATLVEGMQRAGTHAVSWDASGVASGVYFYRIEAGDQTETRRMVLVR